MSPARGWLVPLVAGCCVTAAIAEDAKTQILQGKPLNEWLMLLRSGNEEERTTAVERLFYNSKLDMQLVVPSLTTALADSSPRVREAATWSLSFIVRRVPVSEGVARALAVAAEDPVGEVRDQAIEALGAIGPAACSEVPVLIRRLNDPSRSLQLSAISALGNIGPGAVDAVPSLAALVERNDSHGSMAIASLGRIGPAAVGAIPALTSVLQDPNRPVSDRMDAAEALWLIARQPQALDFLARMLTYTDAENLRLDTGARADSKIRMSAAKHLGGLGPSARAAIPHLRRALKDQDSCVRAYAAKALWDINEEPDAVPALAAEVLTCRSGYPAYPYASYALQEIGPKARAAAPTLRHALRSRGKELSDTSWYLAAALWHITRDPQLIPLLLEFRGTMYAFGWNLRLKNICDELGPNAVEAVPILIDLYRRETDKTIRWEAAEALKEIDPDAAKKAGIR